MANTVKLDKQGPLWVLGNIVVVTPGTPVNIMSLVDASALNDPINSNVGVAGADEVAWRCTQILIQACKAGASHGTINNVGNIYVIKRGKGAGSGNRDDMGVIIATLGPVVGAATVQPPIPLFSLPPLPLDRTWINPYDILIDADNANDGAQVTLVI